MSEEASTPDILPRTSTWDFLNVGLIQTNLDHKSAWQNGPPMAPLEQSLAWEEIQRCLRSFRSFEPRPHLVLIPELSVPRGRMEDLRRAAGVLGALIIAGIDYRLDYQERKAYNEAAVFIPSGWRHNSRGGRVAQMFVGKTYAAKEESKALKKTEWNFVEEPNFWVFEGADAGRLGVSIRYDFLDVERALMYKQQIQHLIVIAYNRDGDSFLHIAEGLARTVYCNVVVCNTGFHGGSLGITPYYEPWERTVYRHNGNQMLASQVIKIPVRSLIEAQMGNDTVKKFKSLPPGWSGISSDTINLLKKLKLRQKKLD